MEQEIKTFDMLNTKQKAAVLYNEGPLRIIAGAGTGKTRVLTQKIIYLIQNMKVPPFRILAVTFTNKATKEMRERVKLEIGESSEKIYISTFHSLCSYILRLEISSLGYKKDFEILDYIDQKNIVDSIYKKIDINNSTIPFGVMIEYISRNKIELNSWEDLESQAQKSKDETEILMAEVYKQYEAILKKNQYLDFDDLLIFTYKLFKENLEIAKKWANKFDYVLVDEFQDTSYIQYEIIKSIAKKKNNITVVGDPDQTIYTWRGADVSLILNFDKDFPSANTVYLEENYRSTPNILKMANRLIQNNKDRLEKNLFTEIEEGDDPEFFHAFSTESEAKWIANKINDLKKQKVQLKNIAILIRSNSYSRALEQVLIKENIGHRILGGQKFYERTEIKDVLAYLRLIHDGSELAFRRVINVPARKIGISSMEKIIEFSALQDKSSYDALTEYFENLNDNKKDPNFQALNLTIKTQKNIVDFFNAIRWAKSYMLKSPISIVIKKFLNKIGYYAIFKDNDKMLTNAVENIDELISSIKNWENKNPDKGLADYLEEISLLTSKDWENLDNPFVSILTIHVAKGLEFQNVFIAGMSEGFFPHKLALKSKNPSKALEEERRLAYVAITRAKEKLFLSDSQAQLFDKNEVKGPSRFLEEMGIKIGRGMANFLTKTQNEGVKYDKDNSALGAGDMIMHVSFGAGVILEDEGETIVVKFNDHGDIKTLLKNHKSLQKFS